MTQPDPGFAILPDVLSDAELEALLDACSSMLTRSRAGVRNALGHSAVSSIARDSRLVRIASDVLGGEAFPFKATLFEKSGRARKTAAFVLAPRPPEEDD